MADQVDELLHQIYEAGVAEDADLGVDLMAEAVRLLGDGEWVGEVGPIRVLGRGLGEYADPFEDLDGHRVKVTQSSLATEDAIRVYVDDACAHLGFEHAAVVVWGLLRWIREHFPREWAHLHPPQRERDHEIVCLCGSTRFADQHAIRRWELERDGHGKTVVLMINYLPHWWAESQGWDGNDHFGERTGTKEVLDELHLRKIDLADRVEVINPGGYVGESTAREIVYAKKTGKRVTYMEDEIHGPGVAILGLEATDE